MSIVHMDKIWVEIAKNFEMRTSGGRGGSQRIRTPPDEGGGGVKKGQIFADVLYGWPLKGPQIKFSHISMHRPNQDLQNLKFSCLYLFPFANKVVPQFVPYFGPFLGPLRP